MQLFNGTWSAVWVELRKVRVSRAVSVFSCHNMPQEVILWRSQLSVILSLSVFWSRTSQVSSACGAAELWMNGVFCVHLSPIKVFIETLQSAN